jgi:hypothetical protein
LRIIFPPIILLKLQLIHLDPIDGAHINRADAIVFAITEDPYHHTNSASVTKRMQGVLVQECIIGMGFNPVDIYGRFLGVDPEVTILVCVSVSGLRRNSEKEEKTDSRTKAAVAGHDFDFS